MSSGNKQRGGVASRYLAAIHCPADQVVTVNAHRPLSPQTFPLTSPTAENESFGSSKQSSIIQSRSIGNSPSSSRRSRASRTPPRDSISRESIGVDATCNSIPQLRTTGFFPATSSGLVATTAKEENDTDGSSLTNSRSSTPPLYEEDDTLVAEREASLTSPYRLSRSPPKDRKTTNDWRSRLDGTANYKKKRDSQGRSPRTSPPSSFRRQEVYNQEEAPTEVMMNLSSIQRQHQLQPRRRSPETMTDVTGTSTEIITNRAVDLHRKILRDVDERDSMEPSTQRPLHEERGSSTQYNDRRSMGTGSSTRTRQWPPPQRSPPPPRRSPIEIKSLLSDSVTEATEESAGLTRATLYPGSMPMGRLGRHVGEDKLQENVASVQQQQRRQQQQQQQQQQNHQRQESVGSLQDRSLTSSVGVETGVHAVPKSEPALKRVFNQTQPDDGIPKQQPQQAKDIALTRPLSPHQEDTLGNFASSEETNYRVPRIGEFPPRAPPSEEKQQASISSNPFMVKYSARSSPASERRGLLDVGSPQQSSVSSGGWTPVPLSSSGMISEDFVLDPNHTPLGKDAQPITALFSADRIPSTSKSPFEKLYRSEPSTNNNEGESLDSSGVGPPNIHRITADQHLYSASPPDAPGVVAGDDHAEGEEEDLIPGMTPNVRPPVESPLAVSAPAAIITSAKEKSNYSNVRRQLTRSLPLNRARRRALLKGRQQWPPQNDVERHDDDVERDVGEAAVDESAMEKRSQEMQAQNVSSVEPRETTSVSRNLFPSEDVPEHQVDISRREPPVDNYTKQVISGRESPLHSPTTVQDRVTSFSPPRESHQYVPPWKAKLKEQRTTSKAKPDDAAERKDVGDSEQPVANEYIPPWKRKLMENKLSANKARTVDLNKAGANDDLDQTTNEYISPSKRKMTEQQRPATSANQVDARNETEIVPASTEKETDEYISPWKLKATAKKSIGTKGDQVNASDASIPKWKLELLKKKGLVIEDKPAKDDNVKNAATDVSTERPKQTTGFRPSPPKPLFSVKERVNSFSSPTVQSQQYVPPWVAKARAMRKNGEVTPADASKTPTGTSLARFQGKSLVKSAPPRLSGRDRAVAMSGDTNESSHISGSSSRSKRSYSEAIPEESNPTGEDGQSPTKAIKTSENPRRHRVAAQLLGAVPAAQVDPSVASGPSVDDSKAKDDKSPQKSLLLAAHLAATVDEVSPQDRYRRRFKNTDDTTATGGTRESDVQSLKSFFEASVATGPSDEDDSDDRTVESLRSKFETIPENEERPNDVSKMRAKFENRKASSASKIDFGGNTAVSDAFSKFKPATARWTPPSATKSPKEEARSSPVKETLVSSAPSKLQTRTRPARSPPPKPEDMVRVVPNKAGDGDGPRVMSVAERIRALKLKQSPQATPKEPPVPPQESARNARGGFLEGDLKLRSTWNTASNLTQNDDDRVKSRDPPVGNESHQARPEAVPSERAATPKRRSPRGASYPSVRDRVNAFSGKAQGQTTGQNTTRRQSDTSRKPVAVQSAAPGRKSWPPEDRGIRSYSNRHSSTRAIDGRNAAEEQGNNQVMSTPSDEKTGSDTRRSLQRSTSQASSEGSSHGTGSDYDDGVTLDLSIAEISQLTNPTCIQSKEGGADSSSEGDASSEHTSDVNRGSNVEGKHPSEASSSQTSEAAAPLIARMKFSDDASNSVSSDKGAFPRSARTNRTPPRWEPLTPVVDEAEPTRLSPDGTHESAWSPDEIKATFPVESAMDNAVVSGNKDWQPFKVESWEPTTSFGSNWTPPSNVDAFETNVSKSMSFGRHSENTPVRRNTSAARRASPPQSRPSPPGENAASPAQRSLFSRTHPSRPSTSPVAQPATATAAPRSSPTSVPVTPRSSPSKTAIANRAESAPDGLSPTGISKHALLMSKLRSLKEARMRRNAAAAGFQRNTVYPSSDRRTTANQRPPPAGGTARSSPPASALSPFLHPGFANSSKPTSSPPVRRYPDRAPRSSPVLSVDDEQSLSTKSSTQFGGYKFVESLELD